MPCYNGNSRATTYRKYFHAISAPGTSIDGRPVTAARWMGSICRAKSVKTSIMQLRKASPPSRAQPHHHAAHDCTNSLSHAHTCGIHSHARTLPTPAGASRPWHVKRAPACAEHQGGGRHAGLQRASAGTAQAAAIAAGKRLPTAAGPQRPESAPIGEQMILHVTDTCAQAWQTRRAWDTRISCSVVRQSHLGDAEQHQRCAA